MCSYPSHSLRGDINHSLSYSHFNRVPMSQGNQGKPGENFLLKENLKNSRENVDFA